MSDPTVLGSTPPEVAQEGQLTQAEPIEELPPGDALRLDALRARLNMPEKAAGLETLAAAGLNVPEHRHVYLERNPQKGSG